MRKKLIFREMKEMVKENYDLESLMLVMERPLKKNTRMMIVINGIRMVLSLQQHVFLVITA